jgi:glycosyltransferase involved in cell wall biosynthesis
MDKILIVIPAFNSERYIAETIDSILNQKDVDIHLVIIDDASTDNTASLVSSKYPKIDLIRNKVNSGPYVSINKALLKYSKEDFWNYFSIHGSDDVSYPNRYTTQLEILKYSPRNYAIGCGFRRVDFKTKRLISVRPHTNESMLLMKREIFKNIGYYDTNRVGCDTEYKRRIEMAMPGAILGFSEILLDAYVHDSNLTKKIPIGGTHRMDYVKAFTKRHQSMKENNNYYQDFKI